MFSESVILYYTVKPPPPKIALSSALVTGLDKLHSSRPKFWTDSFTCASGAPNQSASDRETAGNIVFCSLLAMQYVFNLFSSEIFAMTLLQFQADT